MSILKNGYTSMPAVKDIHMKDIRDIVEELLTL